MCACCHADPGQITTISSTAFQVCNIANVLYRAGVNGILISWFAADKTSSDCRVKIAELLQVTGAYSISGMHTCINLIHTTVQS